MVQNHANTRIVSPTRDPGYPTPELATVVLVGVGLVAVVGALRVRRPQGDPTRAS